MSVAKKCLWNLIGLALCLVGSVDIASATIGTRGGGNVIVCFEKGAKALSRTKATTDAGRLQNVYLQDDELKEAKLIQSFDLYEALSSTQNNPYSKGRSVALANEGEAPNEYITRVLGRFDGSLNNFQDEMQDLMGFLPLSAARFSKHGVEAQQDFSSVAQIDLTRCRLTTAVVQEHLKDSVALHIDLRIWESPLFSDTSRAVVYLHEIIYYAYIRMGITDSDLARRFVLHLLIEDQNKTLRDWIVEADRLSKPEGNWGRMGVFSNFQTPYASLYEELREIQAQITNELFLEKTSQFVENWVIHFEALIESGLQTRDPSGRGWINPKENGAYSTIDALFLQGHRREQSFQSRERIGSLLNKISKYTRNSLMASDRNFRIAVESVDSRGRASRAYIYSGSREFLDKLGDLVRAKDFPLILIYQTVAEAKALTLERQAEFLETQSHLYLLSTAEDRQNWMDHMEAEWLDFDSESADKIAQHEFYFERHYIRWENREANEEGFRVLLPTVAKYRPVGSLELPDLEAFSPRLSGDDLWRQFRSRDVSPFAITLFEDFIPRALNQKLPPIPKRV